MVFSMVCTKSLTIDLTRLIGFIGFERVAVFEQRIDDGVALLDLRRGVVVENHVHARQTGGGGIFFLAFLCHFDVFAVPCLVADFQ